MPHGMVRLACEQEEGNTGTRVGANQFIYIMRRPYIIQRIRESASSMHLCSQGSR